MSADPISPDRGPGFIRLGPSSPICPVVLSVPHAGREYPATLLAMARVPRDRLEALEDRYADTLIDDAVTAGTTAFVATRARPWIDLNRDEREVDSGMIDPPPRAQMLVSSAKVRGGLGLVPRRLASTGELWSRRLSSDELVERIIGDHRPWHMAIAAALREAHARFGTALLIDCHSMPPLPRHGATQPPQVVLGDRYGRTAPGTLMDRLASVVDAAGLVCARNSPYAGGHTLERQAMPARGIHAIQVEVDRSLYLDSALREPGDGLRSMRRLLAAMVAAMVEELSTPLHRAAE
ncbi:N-formylglutamate amidohydrolase [Sphingomonas laterariae]|uniref:N-formylglutamate amidohydrolase n=1 Tax=Edaphosphingomonas laterariae TaxID=861865 RepID=A0A239CBL9_9SPHN|nr:N-formylglutamate amidohydrolase [Sphingomonas laterariae]SNS17282.1 N-formylglutamate amidohydrolase [Sphingomonas laterariae]